MFFKYGKVETDYLKSRDKILGDAIDKIGHLKRPVETDLFLSLAHTIIGQQISSAAQNTIWKRMKEELGKITADTIDDLSVDKIQAFGMTFRKAEYIKDFSHKIKQGCLNLEDIKKMSDADAINELSKLKGVGRWTAEMVLIFCLQRPDVLSYDDLAIQRGLRMLYHHREVNKKLFEKYRRRYSPYCTVASLYLWSVSSGILGKTNPPVLEPRKRSPFKRS